MPTYGIEIGKLIYNILANDASLVSLAGGVTNIQPSAIYTSSPKAGIYYDILSVENENTKTLEKADLAIVTFQIECFTAKYADAINLATKIEKLLDKLTAATYNTISAQSCTLQSQSTDFDGENKLYYIQSSYKARINL